MLFDLTFANIVEIDKNYSRIPESDIIIINNNNYQIENNTKDFGSVLNHTIILLSIIVICTLIYVIARIKCSQGIDCRKDNNKKNKNKRQNRKQKNDKLLSEEDQQVWGDAFKKLV